MAPPTKLRCSHASTREAGDRGISDRKGESDVEDGYSAEQELMRRTALLAALVVAAALAAGVFGTGKASAVGNDAVHQVTISSSITPNLFGPGTGGGIHLRIELVGTSPTSGGTGDYTGSDCIHHTPLGPTSAHPDSGEVTWSVSGTTITIVGVTIGDDNQPVTITVPLSGNERTDNASVFSPPVGFLPGRAEVQVTG